MYSVLNHNYISVKFR